jgi:hypothetical protein
VQLKVQQHCKQRQINAAPHVVCVCADLRADALDVAAAQATAQLKGLVLLSARLPAPWERVVQLDFGSRPGEAPSKSVFCEVMAK